MIWILTIFASLLLLYYCVLLLLLKRGLHRLQPGSSLKKPFVSIIIPARNEEKDLPKLIKSLLNQTYPAHLTEIILVNDRSSDKTGEIIHNAATNNPNVKQLHINHEAPKIAPKKWAITKGIEVSRGELIFTTDADSLPTRSWIQGMVQYYEENTGMVLGYAPYSTDQPYNSLFHHLLALEYFSLGAVIAGSVGIGYPTTANGANFSFKKKIFLDIGGYGETIKWISGDDDLFMHRVKQKYHTQIRFSINHLTKVINQPPVNFIDFYNQRIRFASKHLAYPKGLKIGLFFVYLFYVCLAALIITTFFNLIFGLHLLFLLGIKTIFELTFLKKAQKILESRNLLRYYPVAMVPHIFYIAIFPLLGQMIRPKWK